MKPTNTHPAETSDVLHWTMRIGGVVVVLLSTFLLVKNIGFGIGDDILCTFSLGLGVFSFGASWLPSR